MYERTVNLLRRNGFRIKTLKGNIVERTDRMSKKKYFPHGKNRRVYTDGQGHIVYEYITAGLTAYCTYNEILYLILNDPGLSPFCDKSGMIRFVLQKRNSEIRKCKLSLLCQACYDGRITSVDTWQKEYRQYRNWMNNFKYQVDHADSNQLNCTRHNLSIMKRAINHSKNNITAIIKEPVVCYSGHYGDEYRIVAYWPNIKSKKKEQCGVTLKLKCRSASDYVSCMREIEDLESGYGKPIFYLDENGSLKQVKTSGWKKHRPCVATESIKNSLYGQELMTWMFDCEFTPYKVGEIKALFNQM